MKVAAKAVYDGAFLLAACEAWNEAHAYSWITTQELQHRWVFDNGSNA